LDYELLLAKDLSLLSGEDYRPLSKNLTRVKKDVDVVDIARGDRTLRGQMIKNANCQMLFLNAEC